MTRDDLLRKALVLPLDERVLLVNQLLASLHGEDDATAQKEWATEIDRRIAAYDRGEIDSFSEKDVRRHAAPRKTATMQSL